MSSIAVITGGSRGIGRAVSVSLAKKGYYVVINYTSNQEAAMKALEALKEQGGEGELYQAPVENYSAIQDMGEYVNKELGTPAVLVNNAGINQDQLFIRMKPEDFKKVIDVNLTGVYNCSKVFTRAMLKQKTGSMINMSSVAGVTGNPGQANYAASKSGVIGFTKTLAREFANRGIRVNAVAPGFIDTEMTSNLSESMKEQMLQQIPMGRYGSPEEVARVVSFLADEASYLTGQVIHVDGGMVM